MERASEGPNFRNGNDDDAIFQRSTLFSPETNIPGRWTGGLCQSKHTLSMAHHTRYTAMCNVVSAGKRGCWCHGNGWEGWEGWEGKYS